jgi:predicted phage terminase large subunit-like protein
MSAELFAAVGALRRLQAERSLEAFTRLYLAHHVDRRLAPAHEEIYTLLEGLTRKRGGKLAIAAPRGFGKSTLVTLAYVLYGICFGKERFIVIISATASQAAQHLEAIRRELTDNDRLLTDFPELAGPSPRPWTRADIVAPNHARVLALGVHQHIRGRKHGKDRPTLVIADDLELAKQNFSSESREALKSWFTSSILKAGSEATNFLFLGTLHHPFSLLAEYVDPQAHPEWTKQVYKAVVAWSTHSELWAQWGRIYNSQEVWQDHWGPDAARAFYDANQEALDEGTQVLWPERWSYYGLMVEREDDLISFNSELQNEPINPRDCLFNVEEFTYWDEEYGSVDVLLRALGEEVEFYGACDPSLGRDKTRGDYTALVILARAGGRRRSSLYLIEADLRRCSPAETIETIFAYYARYRFRNFAIETNQFQELLAQEVERRGRELGLYPPIERVTHTRDKILRVQTLHPWLKNGTVRVSRRHALLLEQARFFPKGKHDDGLDALEMAVRLAETTHEPRLVVISLDPKTGEDDDVRWVNLD